jgi:uncharacterized lipoprotein YmbA
MIAISSRRYRLVSIVLLAVGLQGCVNLKAPPDPTRYYLLNGASEPEQMAESPMQTGPVVRIDRIELEPYLDTRFMVLRLQEYEVQFSDIHRWGEELADNIQRALARDLKATGAVSDVVTSSSDAADYVLRVHIHRFEGVPPDIAHLSATWKMTDQYGEVLQEAFHDDRNRGWQFENYGHLAEKLDESLNAMAAAIAEKLP